MICPDCQSKLEEVDYRGMRIHDCPQCRGRWLARDELIKAKDMTDDDLRWLDFDPFGKEAERYHVSPERKSCPQCAVDMDALTYAESGVVIDRCLNCQGVWVHHGEFEKIIQYLENLISSKSGGEYARDSLAQFIQIAMGKEDVVSEIKDFLVVLKLSELRWGIEHPHIADTIKRIHEYLPFL